MDSEGTVPRASDSTDVAEATLLVGLRAGDEGAFEHLVRTHGPRMQLVASRYLPDVEDARECVQDAFVEVCRSLGGYTGESPLSTWLYRLVANVALTKLRRRELWAETLLEELPPGERASVAADRGGGWALSAAEAITRAEIRSEVRASIARLPDSFRVVLLLRDIESMEFRSICEALQMSSSTVRTRLHRGRHALRRMLDPAMRGDPR